MNKVLNLDITIAVMYYRLQIDIESTWKVLEFKSSQLHIIHVCTFLYSKWTLINNAVLPHHFIVREDILYLWKQSIWGTKNPAVTTAPVTTIQVVHFIDVLWFSCG